MITRKIYSGQVRGHYSHGNHRLAKEVNQANVIEYYKHNNKRNTVNMSGYWKVSVTGNSTCKGPEVERNLTCFSNREKFNAVGKSSVSWVEMRNGKVERS